MDQVTQKEIQELTYYQGEHAIAGIKFRYAAKDLGVSAWGMNVIEMEANCPNYPEHDHRQDNQEEVYVVLKGSGTLKTQDKACALQIGSIVRVGPLVKRKILPGPDGITLLALGGTPGQAYKVQS